MPTNRSTQLVFELDAFYRASHMRQKDLADELGLTPACERNSCAPFWLYRQSVTKRRGANAWRVLHGSRES
jgi:hypothetical protein